MNIVLTVVQNISMNDAEEGKPEAVCQRFINVILMNQSKMSMLKVLEAILMLRLST